MNKERLIRVGKPVVVLLTAATILTGCYQGEVVRANDGSYLESYQSCTKYPNPAYRPEGETTNRLAGAIVGGAVGNQFGDGGGKKAMTALGVVLGAAAAHEPATLTRCQTRFRKVPID